ncbi:hypothetical protein HII36_20845 [Nonomuraea sp. NN258]|uniref:hypothetical protein n=1 Tax=Nonomuraea antri TaxID=2730852 RepID=UPI00156A0123|nr:hypothetical protein [Nonomuraea antri]NRQ34282.1 hypothetical protein [Nonomuraea antri]
MQDPIEPDRQEILSGPGHSRRAPKNQKKIVIIAVSALVAILAVGGVGFSLAGGSGESAQQPGAGRPAPTQSPGEAQELQDDEATMGDATTDAPGDDLSTGAEDDSSMGDAVTDGDTPADTNSRGTSQTGNTGNTGSTGKNGSTGNKPGTPTTPAEPPAENPADGPAGELSGQCAKSGC